MVSQTVSAKEAFSCGRQSSACGSPCPATAPQRPPPRRRPAFRRLASRPRVEALEDRCVPSAAGALDPTFGNGAGYVTTSTSTTADPAHSALIQPNGEIVALGSARTSAGGWDFLAERYNLNGSLDTSFGSGGIALASFGSGMARGPYSALYPRGDRQCRQNCPGGLLLRRDETLSGPGALQHQRYPRLHLRHWRRGDDRLPGHEHHCPARRRE